jgi:hypothetical protein
MQRRAHVGLAVLAVVLGIAGCGSVNASAKSPVNASAASPVNASAASPVNASAESPLPAGKSPSAIARMVCTEETAGEIAQVVGAKASVTAPTWADHLYSCGYRYREGTMVLSVKELSSWTQTYAYFDELAQTLHKTASVRGLGQGAFVAGDGSVVVRKDWKILLVDISGLHGMVGSPPSSPNGVALDAAGVILGCWSGD